MRPRVATASLQRFAKKRPQPKQQENHRPVSCKQMRTMGNGTVKRQNKDPDQTGDRGKQQRTNAPMTFLPVEEGHYDQDWRRGQQAREQAVASAIKKIIPIAYQ